MTSARQRAPTGHAGQTVAQERGLARSRRSAEVVIEGPEVDAPGPHLVRVHVSVRETPRARDKAVDAAGAVDAQNAPTAPWKTADGFPQAPTAFFLFLF